MEDSPRLSGPANEALDDPAAEKLVSAASAYEVCLKHRMGKLPGAAVLATAFEHEVAALNCVALPITFAHAEAAGKLDMSHKDPFDRLLIAQALVERVPLVSNEAVFDRFGVERIW